MRVEHRPGVELLTPPSRGDEINMQEQGLENMKFADILTIFRESTTE